MTTYKNYVVAILELDSAYAPISEIVYNTKY